MTSVATTDSSEELVFVPGTLRRCGKDAYRMADATFLAMAWIPGYLYVGPRGPRFQRWQYAAAVVGEFSRVSSEKLSELDRFHGISGESSPEGGGHQRIRARVFLSGPSEVIGEAWIWEWKGSVKDLRLIASGDWLDIESPRLEPWLTWVAAVCLTGLPLGSLAAAISHRTNPLLSDAFSLLAILSPMSGLFASYLAGRRRERAVAFRCIVVVLLILAMIPTVMVIYSLIHEQLRRFR